MSDRLARVLVLRDRVRAGTYVVDPLAVAEAMLDRADAPALEPVQRMCVICGEQPARTGEYRCNGRKCRGTTGNKRGRPEKEA